MVTHIKLQVQAKDAPQKMDDEDFTKTTNDDELNSGLFTELDDQQEFEGGVFAQHEHDAEEEVDFELDFETGFIDTLFDFENFTQTAVRIVPVDTEHTDPGSDGDSWSGENLCDDE